MTKKFQFPSRGINKISKRMIFIGGFEIIPCYGYFLYSYLQNKKNESRKVLYVAQAVHFTHISGMFTSKV